MIPILYAIALLTSIYCAATNNWAALVTFGIGVLCQALITWWRIDKEEKDKS